MERRQDPAGQEEIQWKKKNNNKNKMRNPRRFSDEQIRLLESIFETDTKLEPRKKLQLARELGLQPRQVAIWFQNRRARWKSKQIEQDYRALKADYDKLAARFESLKKEKQSLISQLQNLRESDGEPHDMNKASKDLDGYTKSEPEAEASLSFPLEDRGFLGLQLENEREEFVSMQDEYRNESPASPEKLYGFDSTVNIFDQSCNNPQWLNFWSRGED